ncbi:Sulfotransferase [Thalictrum thalictroides]|uniref:Sulfotransferase n=1 Tax=Thalictrum thalictroides TaxID=46969 RepID=A0A7J6X9M3_THATH|nr:Sulfotransferase [Thalictrum thalictroides]
MDSAQDVQVQPESNEFQELLPSLPCERDAMNLPLYLYKGFWYHDHSLEAAMAFRRHFQAQDSDIILVSAPKSGTTWLKSLVFAITHRLQYTVTDQNHPLLTTNPHGVVPFIEVVYRHNKFPDFTSSPPRIFGTHVPYSMLPKSVKTSKCRMIYLCRNPKDIFVSMWHFGNNVVPKRFPSWQPITIEESFERFCKGIAMFGPCWEQALEYWKLSTEKPEEVLFLKYEDLTEDIHYQLKRIAEHLGCPFAPDEENAGVIEDIAKLCSFEHLSNLEVNKTGKDLFPPVENSAFFRKGLVGDWMNTLTPSMVVKLNQVVDQKLHDSGLPLN